MKNAILALMLCMCSIHAETSEEKAMADHAKAVFRADYTIKLLHRLLEDQNGADPFVLFLGKCLNPDKADGKPTSPAPWLSQMLNDETNRLGMSVDRPGYLGPLIIQYWKSHPTFYEDVEKAIAESDAWKKANIERAQAKSK